MSRETEILKKVKITLDRLKTDLIDDDELFDDELFSDTLEALSIISKLQLYQFKDEVYSALECWDPIIRAKAVSVLGFGRYLHLPEFRERAYEIFMNDPSSNVKSTALSAWSSYYFNTNDKEVLKKLYKTLINEKYEIEIRTEAYSNIFSVYKGKHPSYTPFTETTHLLKSKTQAEFNSKVNWNAIEEIMREYAPEALK